MASETPLDFTTLSADHLLDLFNEALSTDALFSISEEEFTEGISFLHERITTETNDEEREKLFYILTKIAQITQMDYLLDSLYE
jgi:hypothetical protein